MTDGNAHLHEHEPHLHNHEKCIGAALTRARELCGAREVKLTPIREKVLEIVWRSHKPVGAYDVLDTLARTHKAARPPTVYRALDFLMAEGLIHKIESLNAYLGCGEAGHTHESQFLICRSCGTAEEIVDDALDIALDTATKRSGFAVERKVVEIAGVCARCQSL
ncbi:MAG: transcriptional repressor [Pseudomonadota bacterium]